MSFFSKYITSSSDKYRNLKGKHALTKDLFDIILTKNHYCNHINHNNVPDMILYTKEGIIINHLISGMDTDFSGHIIENSALVSMMNAHYTSKISASYYLTIDIDNNEDNIPHILIISLKEIFEKFDSISESLCYGLSCMDYIETPIAIFDSEPALIYANKQYCNTTHIPDISAAIGMNVHDLFKPTEIKFHNSKTSNKWVIYEVLETGQKMVNIDLQIDPNIPSMKPTIFSHDLYPIKNKHGQVIGVFELLSANKLNINNIYSLLGTDTSYTFESIICASNIMKNCIEQAKHFSNSRFNILITGESGVGKELFSQAIHNYSDRHNGPFVALNCANFPENLIESELFGYVSGAFTGASKSGQVGKFELANGGTLFLDEIGELPYHFQAKLLRVLETGRITRIGGTKEINVDVRIVAATNCNLEKMVEEGLFRKDLYYRLQVLHIEIPPLKDRPEDILAIAESFLSQFSNDNTTIAKTFSRSAKDALIQHSWPGNTRELRNVISRISLLSMGDVITKEDVENAIQSKNYSLVSTADKSPEARLEHCKSEVDKAYKNLIEEALEITNDNKHKAAELLGVSRTTLYRMIEKYCDEKEISC